MINFLTAALQRATELYDHGLKMWVKVYGPKL